MIAYYFNEGEKKQHEIHECAMKIVKNIIN